MIIDKFGDRRYKIGLHTHTVLSDGHATPEEAAIIYRDAGYDAIAITDHWKYFDECELYGLHILSGAEYNVGGNRTENAVIHIVGVGMKHDPSLPVKAVTAQEAINAVNAAGGIAILAHPAWSLNTPEQILPLSGIAATEIYNTVSNLHESSRPYSGYFVDILANRGRTYPLVAADDTHYYDGDQTVSYIMARAKSDSTDDILDSIRRGDFYATQGPELYTRREGNKIILDCSPCEMIDFLSSSAWEPERITRGEGLTHAEYEITDHEMWVRAEIHANGKSAWSSIYLA